MISIIPPNRYLTRFIHAPGLGNAKAIDGNAATIIHGSAIPTARAVKIPNIVGIVVARAKATAVPRNGAEHGVANSVANIP